MKRLSAISILVLFALLGTECGASAQFGGFFPDAFYAHANLRKVRQLEHSGRDDEALALLNKLIKETPDDVPVYVKRGMLYERLTIFDKAIADYSSALRIRPFNMRARMQRGMCYVKMRQSALAIKDFNLALKHDDLEWEPWYWRGVAYAYDMDMNAALPDLKKALSLKNSREVYYSLGTVYVAMDNLQEALPNFTSATTALPKYPMAYLVRGRCYHAMKRYKEAIADYNEAIQLRRGYWRTYALRAQTFEKMGEVKKAARDMEQASINEPELAETFFENSIETSIAKASKKADFVRCAEHLKKALKLRDSNDLEGAKRELGKALAINAGDQTARLWRARLNLMQRNYDEALKDCLLVVHSGEPAANDVNEICGSAYMGLKKYDRAYYSFNQGLFWLDDWIAGNYHKATALEALKRQAEAIECYKRFIKDMKNPELLKKSEESKSQLQKYLVIAEKKVKLAVSAR